jgi:plasmid maintenance system antidote protein VapI
VTFLEAFTKYGPDVERVAEALGITPPEADRLINEAMDRRHQKRMAYRRRPA